MSGKRQWNRAAAFAAIIILAGLPAGCGKEKPEHYLEVEFKRIEETHRLIETYGEEIWPGWDNHRDIQFNVQFPNMVHLIVNPIEDVPEGYVQIAGRTVAGQDIFINRTNELPIEIKPPLLGGGGGGSIIRIMLGESEEAGSTGLSREKRSALASENQILLYVHEFFHGYQEKVLPWMQRPKKPKEKVERPPRPKNWRPELFNVNIDYAVYKEIAGRALLEAYLESDDDRARGFLKDYVVARERQLSSMPEQFAAAEIRTQVAEGTASYSDAKMALLIMENGHKPAITSKVDPFFFEYAYLDAYIKRRVDDAMDRCIKDTLDTLLHSYTFGAYQCFLLDRFHPGWKKGFFEGERTMDEVMAEYLGMSEEDKRSVEAGFKDKFGIDEIRGRHAAVIEERDSAIAAVENRTGRTFIVDFEETREFFLSKPRGKSVTLGVRQIFLEGVEEITMGDVRMTSIETPMERDWLWTVQWIDTEAGKGEKGYELDYEWKEETEEGPVFMNVTFTTRGFALQAPEVRISEEEGDVVRVEILSKVARTPKPHGENP